MRDSRDIGTQAEFCKPFPKRLRGIAMLNIDSVAEGVKELERCAKAGLGEQ